MTWHWSQLGYGIPQGVFEEIPCSARDDKSDPHRLPVIHPAEAHFALATACLHNDDFNAAVEHYIAQLRIKIEIGKLSGIAAGLFNIGIILERGYPILSAATSITSQEIEFEIDIVTESRSGRAVPPQIEALAEVENRAAGREFIAKISDELLPYYDRAIERRLQGS